MDPAMYWTITRRKLGDQKAPVFSTPHITVGSGGGGGSSASYYESWEERAFAQDSAGNLGGCIWPPRSYSCSFCCREFRSAQALGGHMNVHRRDRARLKLSGALEHGSNENHGMPPHQGYMIQPRPPQIGAPQHAYSPKPSAPSPSRDTNPNSICSVLACPSRSLVQATAARAVWGKPVLSAPLASPSPAKEYGKTEMFLCAAKLPQDHLNQATRMCFDQELRVWSAELRLSVLGCRTRGNFEDDDEADDQHIVHTSRNIRRVDAEVTPLVLPSSKHLQRDGDDHGYHNHRAKVLKLCPSSPVEELDLELRL